MLIIAAIVIAFLSMRRRAGKKRWVRPWISRYEVCEPGDVVVNGGNVYIIKSLSVSTSRGRAGPCCYEVIKPDGTLGSLENWCLRKVNNERKDHEGRDEEPAHSR